MEITYRGLPPLVPIVRLADEAVAGPQRSPFPMVAALVLILLVSSASYVTRPDGRYVRVQTMIEAYEQGLAPNERDYSLPMYADAVRDLESVSPLSSSRSEAERLAARLRRAVARYHEQQALEASLAH